MNNPNFAKNNAAINRIRKSFDRYNLEIRNFRCRYDSDRGAYVYGLLAARKGSGSRGGHLRNRRCWELLNLTPEQRQKIEALG
jgi:hypothetical protein